MYSKLLLKQGVPARRGGFTHKFSPLSRFDAGATPLGACLPLPAILLLENEHVFPPDNEQIDQSSQQIAAVSVASPLITRQMRGFSKFSF